MKNVTMICDLQFGSTGKGLIAGYIAIRDCPDVVVTAWMPNAGHTFIDAKGRKYVHTMIANGVVSPGLKYLLIGPGSMINPHSFASELAACHDHILGRGVKVLIHPNAGVVLPEHVKQEMGTMTSIGSTKKGCGAAIAAKIRRDPDNLTVASHALIGTDIAHFVCTKKKYNDVIDGAQSILVEGAQGFSLSINHGFYPYCTSRDVTPAQILADTAIPFNRVKTVIGVMRAHPIRVANRFDDKGNMIGYSGPCYWDQVETSWNRLGVTPEYTTVTKLQRRVFTFSKQQILDAVRMCQPDEIFLNFANYLSAERLHELENVINAICGFRIVRYFGFGPAISSVVDIFGGEGS